MIKTLALIPLLLSVSVLAAQEGVALGESPRGALLGGAYTSLADDDYSLFYNPALLGRHSGFSFYPINPTINAVNVLKDADRFEDLGDDPSDVADAALGFPIHARVNFAPGFKMGHFGMTALMNNQTNISLSNKVAPVLDIDHRDDKGFIAGVGLPVKGNYSNGSGNQLSIGASIKYLNREAINRPYYLFGTKMLDALTQEEISDLINTLDKVKGQGWGFDAGIDYINSTGNSTFAAGLSFLDIVTNIQTEDNDEDIEVQDQPMQVNFGTSITQKLGQALGYTFALDIKQLSEDVEFMRRVHLGGELHLTPALSVLGGVNAIDNYSYGLKFNAGMLKVYAGIYGVETGEKLGQEDSNRFLVYLSLFNFHFMP